MQNQGPNRVFWGCFSTFGCLFTSVQLTMVQLPLSCDFSMRLQTEDIQQEVGGRKVEQTLLKKILKVL